MATIPESVRSALAVATIKDALVGAKKACTEIVKPKSRQEYHSAVTECVFKALTELQKATISSRQYILTLWPAFVGFICALAPDPSVMIYDNVWWACLFAMTSSGTPGVNNSPPSHHIHVTTNLEGRSKCEDSSQPENRSHNMNRWSHQENVHRVRLEWIAFTICLLGYFAFCAVFGWTLYNAVTVSFPVSQWFGPAVWYYISAAPAIWEAINHLLADRVELYEPIVDLPLMATEQPKSRTPDKNVSIGSHQEKVSSMAILESNPNLGQSSMSSDILPNRGNTAYHRVHTQSSVRLWLRITNLQWRRSPYRVLINPPSANSLIMCSQGFAGIGRLSVFVLGSFSMGNILLMPIPNDLVLFIVLIFVTAVPRQLWLAFWGSQTRGADLVVWVGNSS